MAKRNWEEVGVEDGNVWDKETPLEGVFLKTESGIGANKSNMYTIKPDDGEEVKVWGSTVLDDKLMGVPKGTYVKIEYEGKKTSKNGGQYHSYKVFIDLNSKQEGEPPLTDDDLPPEFLEA